MINDYDKVLGSWLGIAIGEAMGSAVRGMKPATIKQYFHSMDDYKEVRPFIGKGVKNYRMKGLYGTQTQTALVLCDLLLSKKKVDRDTFLSNLLELKQTGPELYYGVYRRSEACFRRALESIPQDPKSEPPDSGIATATFAALGVIPALYYRGRTKLIVQNSLSACLILSRKFQELVGALFMARFVDSLLRLSPEHKESRPTILKNAVRFALEAESELLETLPFVYNDLPKETIHGLSSSFENLIKKELDTQTAMLTIARYAEEKLNRTISHSTQGTLLTLVPTGLWMLAKCNGFAETLTTTLDLGGEADKLGTIVGALAGAYYGFKAIPVTWSSGLVNIKEIKRRGEALAKRKRILQIKPLFQMEFDLTSKEAEERKRFLANEQKKKPRQSDKSEVLGETEETLFPERQNRKEKRSYEREKSRKKRDRRRNLDFE